MNTFAYPEMGVWMLAPIGVFALGLWLARWRRSMLGVLGTVTTIDRLLPAHLAHRRRWVLAFETLGMLCLAAAIAGPLLGSRLVEFRQKGLDVFIAVDCSLSMQAQDFQPSRMAHARLVLGQIIERLGDSRLGVIAFAGQAYVQCPLTIDQSAVSDTLDTLDPGAVPIPGTQIGDAIRLALKGMQAGESANRVLVLLTDGEDHDSDPRGAAKEAAQAGMKIYTIGIGSVQGEPIPLLDDAGQSRGFKRDAKGEVVLSKMDETLLSDIARETGGQYFRASPAGDEVEPLARALDEIRSGDRKTQLFNRYENRYQWPLALGIALLLIALAVPERGWRKT